MSPPSLPDLLLCPRPVEPLAAGLLRAADWSRRPLRSPPSPIASTRRVGTDPHFRHHSFWSHYPHLSPLHTSLLHGPDTTPLPAGTGKEQGGRRVQACARAWICARASPHPPPALALHVNASRLSPCPPPLGAHGAYAPPLREQLSASLGCSVSLCA